MSDDALLIVGGGPAGLATALFAIAADPSLAGRITVLERAHYPREKPCAGALADRADRALAAIGVRVDVPSVPLTGLALALSAGALTARVPVLGRVVRRSEYDAALARCAVARGARIVEGARVSAVLEARAGLVRVASSAGEFTARALVGADGVGSVVRRARGLPAGRLRAQAVEVDTLPVASDLPRDLLRFDARDAALPGYTWDFPTLVDGQPLVCRGAYCVTTPGSAHPDVTALLAQHLAARGLSLADYTVKRYAERGFEPHRAYAAPGVLLVGEAAGIDVVTGEGIAQAIEYGACAGPYLAARLAQGSLAFTDWPRAFYRARVGRDLLARVAFAPLLRGRGRRWVDRALCARPALVTASMAHFAGDRVGVRGLLRALALA